MRFKLQQVILAWLLGLTCTGLLAQENQSTSPETEPQSLLDPAPAASSEGSAGLRAQPQQTPQNTTPDEPTQPADSSDMIVELSGTVQSRQAQLETLDQSVEVRERLQQFYSQALSDLKIASDSRSKRQENFKRTQAAPGKITALRADEPDPSEAPDDNIEWLTFDQANDLVTRLKSELSTENATRTSLEQTIASRRGRRGDLPSLISKARSAIDELPQQPTTIDEEPLVAEAQKLELDAERLMKMEQALLLESELQMYDAESALLPLQLEESKRKIQQLQTRIREAEDRLGDERLWRINEFAARFADVEGDDSEAYQKLRGWLGLETENQDDTDEDDMPLTWRGLSQKLEELGQEYQTADEELKFWRDIERNMQSRMTPSKNGDSFASANRWVVERLRKQRNDLPNLSQLQTDLREYQSEFQMVQSLEYDLSEIDRLLSQKEYAKDPPEYVTLGSEIIDEMKQQTSSCLNQLLKLLDRKAETKIFVGRYREFIDKQLLWIPNAETLGLKNLPDAGEAFRWLVSVNNWKNLSIQLYGDLRESWAIYVLSALLLGYLISKQPDARRLLKERCAKAERSSCTQFSLSTDCLLLTLLIAIPLPLLLLFFTWRINASIELTADPTFAKALAGGCLIAAATWFPMELLRQVVRAIGLGIQHFDWQESNAQLLRTNLRWLIDFTVPLAALVGMFDFQPNSRWEDSFGRCCFILLMPIVSIFFGRIMSPRKGVPRKFIELNKDGWIDQLSILWFPLVLIVPIVFAVLSFIGYHYTSQQLALRLISTLWVSVLFIVAYSLLQRWLVLKRRKLVVAQARQRLEEAAAARDAPEGQTLSPVKGEEQLNLVAIDQQTKRLLASICVVGSLVFSYIIWADVLPAISLLDNVVLWTVAGEKDDVPITLSSLLQVVPVIILATVAARNLPGLLEIAFLQHLPLTTAARYAVSTLASYAIAAIGVAVTGSVLGLRWENIQWIVAGLGVGLGFGLQEIFANFIAGIILLFEQPIRVGDVVTIDGTTGSVAKIRIRATTVVNWDRQELIVPNKELITGKLINWTLSDSTNRVVINVGVAYGTDTERACQILQHVCEQHPNLMHDPAPMITFEGFGDNTLNLVVRAYLETLDNRLSTIHSLHKDIYEAFNKASIEISFPQRDLHVRTLPESLTNWLREKQ